MAAPPPARHRILQLASTSDIGGAERMIIHLVNALDTARFEPFVAATVGGGALLESARSACTEVADLRFGLSVDPFGIARLTSFIRRNRIDLVQTHGLRADTAGRIAAKLGGARAVVGTIHSIDPWRRWHHTALDRATGALVNQYVAVCRAARDAASKRESIPASCIEVIPIGVPPFDVPLQRREAVRCDLSVPEDAFPVVGILANLREMKGHRDTIEAMPQVLTQFPKACFIFAGRDDSGGVITQLAQERGLASHVRLPGFVGDTAGLFAALDMFLLPSHWEGLPVSVIEAMHAAMPIIASRVGGIPELIEDGETGLLIEPRQRAQIAEAVIRLADDAGLRRRLGAAGKTAALARYSVSQMASAYEQLFQRLLALS